MSEYQYYEFQTIDRLLTEKEQREVNELSSHIDVTSSRAVVTYNWGDFKHDPREVVARYFDAFLYTANWGTRRLIFRFPKAIMSRPRSNLIVLVTMLALRPWVDTGSWKSSGMKRVGGVNRKGNSLA